jgi:hypothetical protein
MASNVTNCGSLRAAGSGVGVSDWDYLAICGLMCSKGRRNLDRRRAAEVRERNRFAEYAFRRVVIMKGITKGVPDRDISRLMRSEYSGKTGLSNVYFSILRVTFRTAASKSC